MSVEDRLMIERSLTEMMKEALKAFHRRLLVVCGKEAVDVLAYIVSKHRAIRGESDERVVFVDDGNS
ncbi:MAG: hypothetical protein QXJ31_05870, partial [Candidatus Bathyarchaeia archaeon]